MTTFVSIALKILGGILLMCAAADLLQWAFTGTWPNTAGTMVTGLINDVTGLPTKILCMIQNLLYAVINVGITVTFALVPGLGSPPTIPTPACP